MLDLQQVQSQPQLAHIMLPNGQLQQVQIMAAAAPGLSARLAVVSLGQLAGEVISPILMSMFIYAIMIKNDKSK